MRGRGQQSVYTSEWRLHWKPWILFPSIVPIVPRSSSICSHCFLCTLLSTSSVCVVFDRRMFLMPCGCHVDILWGLACISHLCRSGCFVCFNYYGRPPVVISHFGGTFKMPQHARLHRGACSLGGGAALSEYSRVSVDSLTDLILLMPGQPTSTGPVVLSTHTSYRRGSPDSVPETYLQLFYRPPRKSDLTLKRPQAKISKY